MPKSLLQRLSNAKSTKPADRRKLANNDNNNKNNNATAETAALLTCLTPVERWMAQLQVQQHSKHTCQAYLAALTNVAKFLAAKKLDWTQFDKRQLSRYIGKRLDGDGIQLSSMQQELSAMRHFYTWLIKQNLATVNPTTGYRLKRQPRQIPTIADIDLLTQLLDQPMPETPVQARLWIRDKAMFELLYSSGLRVAELVAINVADVDFNGLQVRVTGKGNKTRVVPFGQKAAAALQKYLPHRNLWVENDEALFISEKLGQRLSTRAVQQRLKIAAKRAGIAQNLYPHLLRHCFASHMLSESGNLRAIQEMLGHSDIATTQIYTQVDFARLTQIYDKAHPRAAKQKQ